MLYIQTYKIQYFIISHIGNIHFILCTNNLIRQSRTLMEEILYGNVIYNMLGMEEYVKYLNRTDPAVLKAVEVLDRGESKPQN